MRERDEVLREFGADELTRLLPLVVAEGVERMADRIRELEAASGEPVAWWCDYLGNRLTTFSKIEADVWEKSGVTAFPLYSAPPSAAGVQVTEEMEEAFMAAYAECEFENGGNFTHRMGINAGITAALTAAREVQP